MVIIKMVKANLQGKAFFDTDNDFRVAEYMHFCSQLLIKEPKEKGKSPCMIVFCSFEPNSEIMEYGKKIWVFALNSVIFYKKLLCSSFKGKHEIVWCNRVWGVTIQR